MKDILMKTTTILLIKIELISVSCTVLSTRSLFRDMAYHHSFTAFYLHSKSGPTSKTKSQFYRMHFLPTYNVREKKKREKESLRDRKNNFVFVNTSHLPNCLYIVISIQSNIADLSL